MSFWSKTTDDGYVPSGKDEELRHKAFKRVSKISTEGLLTWGDQACTAMGKGFMDYREHQDLASIAEIATALFTLEAVCYELKLRSTR